LCDDLDVPYLHEDRDHVPYLREDRDHVPYLRDDLDVSYLREDGIIFLTA
jgi:hypothetical protein